MRESARVFFLLPFSFLYFFFPFLLGGVVSNGDMKMADASFVANTH